MIMCFDFYPEAGGWLSSECLSYLFKIAIILVNFSNMLYIDSYWDFQIVHAYASTRSLWLVFLEI